MRAAFVAAVAIAAVTAPAFAAALTPNEIQATFFTGQPFTASAPNIKYKMIFSADGKMSREPVGADCYRILTAGDNKWSVMKGTTWSRPGPSERARKQACGTTPAPFARSVCLLLPPPF